MIAAVSCTSLLGFYPFNTGAVENVIGTMLITHAIIHLADGKDFTNFAPNKKLERVHVNSVKLNGQLLPDLTLTHQ